MRIVIAMVAIAHKLKDDSADTVKRVTRRLSACTNEQSKQLSGSSGHSKANKSVVEMEGPIRRPTPPTRNEVLASAPWTHG
jgi:hypothetical protein